MNIRELCFQVLYEVYQNRSYSNLALNQVLSTHQLSSADRAFLTRVVYGTIQNSRLLDYWIAQETVGKKVNSTLKIIFRMSLYQMKMMDKVPTYAIVNEAVELTKKAIGETPVGFVNAILHRLVRNNVVLNPADFSDSLAYHSMLYSHPEWLVRMIAKQYGTEEAIQTCKENLLPPHVSVRVNTIKTSLESLLKNQDFTQGTLSPVGVHYKGSTPIAETLEYRSGMVAIQDESGQLVAPTLDPRPGEQVLDMAAAPGSKTAHLAALMNNKGQITAVEIHPHRLTLLEEGMKRLGVTNVKALLADATKLSQMIPPSSFNKILLDAPCSGFGVIRRKPDILLHTKQEDLDGLITLQKQMLDEAWNMLKPNGILVYSTCTINKKENHNQVASFLQRHGNATLCLEQQIFPYVYHSDGFYIAKIRKGENHP